jgi:4'-phosphopantetheinyl transferase
MSRVRIVSMADVPDVLGSHEPVVWIAPDSVSLPNWANHPSALTPEEQERAKRIRHVRTQTQFIRGRTMIRAALSFVLGIPPEQIPITTTPEGKPILDPTAGFGELHFNVSHTEGAAMFGIGTTPLGVDAEVHREGRDLTGLVDRYFSADECEQFMSLPDHLRAAGFLRGWTCKEALLKGIGTGMRDLSNCAVVLDPRRPPAVCRHPPNSGVWELECWSISDQLAAAVAVRIG